MKKNIVVVGCGAWGMNLIRNFHALGTLFSICDSDKKRLDLLKISQTQLLAIFSAALAAGKPLAILLAISFTRLGEISECPHIVVSSKIFPSGSFPVLPQKPTNLIIETGNND